MNKISPSQSDQLKEIGTYLKQHRLEKSLTLTEMSASTLIRLPLLRALEEGDLEELPELIYVKGFIRRCGEVLGVDGRALADRLITSETPLISESLIISSSLTPASDYPRSSQRSLSQEGKPSLTWLYFLLGGLSLLGGVLYAFNRPPEPKQANTPQPVAPVSPQPKPSNPPIVKASPPKPSPSATPLSVKVKVEKEAWLKVTVDGKTAHEGNLELGQEKTWTAKKEVKLRSGDAGALKLSVNNKPLKLFGKSGEVKEIVLTPKSN